jgi:hypothetical protein
VKEQITAAYSENLSWTIPEIDLNALEFLQLFVNPARIHIP